MKKPITRRETITECVKTYLRNYPQEYKMLLQAIKEKQDKMGDSAGELIDASGKKDAEFRLGMKLPSRLLGSINQLLTWHDQGVLFEHGDKEEKHQEYEWFKKQFPTFIVPKYRSRTFTINKK